MTIKDIPPPAKSADSGDSNWSQLLNWLSLLWKFVRTPALVVTNGNVPTAPTGTPGDTSTQIATDAFVANSVTTAVATAANSSLAAMAAFAGGDGGPLKNFPNGTWQPWTITFSPNGGSFGASATAIGTYTVINNVCFYLVAVNIPNVGTATGGVIYSLPLPSTALIANGQAFGRDNGASGKMLQAIGNGAQNNIIYNYDNTSPIVAGASLVLSGFYGVLSN